MRPSTKNMPAKVNAFLNRFSHVQAENAANTRLAGFGAKERNVAMTGCTGENAYTASKLRRTRAMSNTQKQ